MEFEVLKLLTNDFSLINNVNYIDPGSASAFIAMIFAAIAGVGMSLKLYWAKVRSKISNRN
tara:strand:- start:3656 stop:3838 length:183 start_codon:yes stop_codon:yes gene_type:complete